MQSIYMSQIFNAPQEEIFEFLSNHNNLGKLLHANITRIKDAEEDNETAFGLCAVFAWVLRYYKKLLRILKHLII